MDAFTIQLEEDYQLGLIDIEDNLPSNLEGLELSNHAIEVWGIDLEVDENFTKAWRNLIKFASEGLYPKASLTFPSETKPKISLLVRIYDFTKSTHQSTGWIEGFNRHHISVPLKRTNYSSVVLNCEYNHLKSIWNLWLKFDYKDYEGELHTYESMYFPQEMVLFMNRKWKIKSIVK